MARGERRQRLGRQLALAPFTGVVDRLLDLTEEGTHLDRSVLRGLLDDGLRFAQEVGIA